ncbi:MAG: hypothetical protein IKX34_02715 [Bacteroidales bacterium]|nr:hypothetical protein [Bacteroidales bacterium]
MKKILFLAMAMTLALACNRSQAPKILVLYYSQTGTTEKVAQALQASLNADIEAIIPVEPYNGDFQATIERGMKELQGGILPELQPLKANVSDYDIIFLGYPVWFGTYAQPIATVLAKQNFDGKKVVPFCTFGSGGLDSSAKAIADKLPNAEVLPGYGVRAARIDAVPAEIDRFLKAGGFIAGEPVKLEDFSASKPVTEEEAAIFDAAVGDYPMMHAKAEEVASRPVPGGMEYLFTARDLPREMPGGDAPKDLPPTARSMKVYVLVEDGQAPVFTQVIR